MPRLLPPTHEASVAYTNYKETFGTDGFYILVGVEDKDFYTPEKYNTWKKLGEKFKTIKGVDSVFSEANFYVLTKNDSLKKLNIKPLANQFIFTQEKLDSVKEQIRNYPFYKNLIYRDSTNFHVQILSVNASFFNSKKRGEFVKNIVKATKDFDQVYNSEFYFTGLPFMRAMNQNTIKEELVFFAVLSLIVTILVLFFLFRSIKVIIVSGTIVTIGVIWTMGLIALFDFKISAIMGLLPPLITVIGIPNCVYLINKYQQLYLENKDKKTVLKTVIIKIGHITLLTNATTAFGLGTFVFTDSPMLIEFGYIASIGIIMLFFLTVLMVPILFSFLPVPKEKHTKHLKKGWLAKFLKILAHLVTNKRSAVFITTSVVIILSIAGSFLLKSTGKLIDDLPNNNKTKTDLAVYQSKYGGTMPLEIILDVKAKGKYQKSSTLQKIDSIQRYLESKKAISRSISFTDGLKFVNQAFYNGNPTKYVLPKGRDKAYIKKYIKNSKKGNLSSNGFIDSTGTKTRISCQINDLGLEELDILLNAINPKVDSILNPDKAPIEKLTKNILFTVQNQTKDLLILDTLFDEFGYLENAYLALIKSEEKELYNTWYENGIDKKTLLKRGQSDLSKAINKTYIGYDVTGFSVPFTKGTKYLINNLIISLLIAIIGISILMSFLFKSFWMVFITVITNLIPLLFTAGLMGYLGVALKPSTILVFSISLGIAVDDAIHYLAKFKQELKATNGDVKTSIYNALSETGISMLYTSIILFFGFSIFMTSSYGANQALGLLISVTLLLAMLSNLVLLPSLLLTFQKKIEK